MSKKILQCTNLIGDSLYLLKPVVEFLKQWPDEAVALITAPGLVYEMFLHTISAEQVYIPVFTNETEALAAFPDAQIMPLSAGQSGEICFPKGLHISEGYAQMLGVKLDSVVPLTGWHQVPDDDRFEPYFLIAPFSRSCSIHTDGVANKSLEDWKWENIIRYLRKHGLPVRAIGGPNDVGRMRCSLSVDDYVTANNLYEMEKILKSAAMLVTLDNGICHVASSLNVPTVILWPEVSSQKFIAPLFGEKTLFLLIGDPNKASPAAMLVGLRKMTHRLLELP